MYSIKKRGTRPTMPSQFTNFGKYFPKIIITVTPVTTAPKNHKL